MNRKRKKIISGCKNKDGGRKYLRRKCVKRQRMGQTETDR